MESTDDALASLSELKDVLKETLGARGVINAMKARVRAEVFASLEEPSPARVGAADGPHGGGATPKARVASQLAPRRAGQGRVYAARVRRLTTARGAALVPGAFACATQRLDRTARRVRTEAVERRGVRRRA